MAFDYRHQTSSPPPDYRTNTGSSNGWLIGLTVIALLGLLAFFSFSGTEQPAPGTTTTQVTPQPAPAPSQPVR
jgi:hypothetical protein